jgi:hypothetical protein
MRDGRWRWSLLVLATSGLLATGPCTIAFEQNVVTGFFDALSAVLVQLAQQQIAGA